MRLASPSQARCVWLKREGVKPAQDERLAEANLLLYLLDIEMPGLSGHEVVVLLKHIRPYPLKGSFGVQLSARGGR